MLTLQKSNNNKNKEHITMINNITEIKSLIIQQDWLK